MEVVADVVQGMLPAESALSSVHRQAYESIQAIDPSQC